MYSGCCCASFGLLAIAELPSALWQEAQRDYAGRKNAQTDWRETEALFKQPLHSLDRLTAGGVGQGLVALWREAKDQPAFAEKFMALLKAGSAAGPQASLAALGADIGAADFWKKAFAQSAKHIDAAAKPAAFNAAAANDNATDKAKKQKPARNKRQEPKP